MNLPGPTTAIKAGAYALAALLIIGGLASIRGCSSNTTQTKALASAAAHEQATQVAVAKAEVSKAQVEEAAKAVERLDRRRLELAPQVVAVATQTPSIVLEQLEVQTQEIEALDLQCLRQAEVIRFQDTALLHQGAEIQDLKVALEAGAKASASEKVVLSLKVAGVSIVITGLVVLAWRAR